MNDLVRRALGAYYRNHPDAIPDAAGEVVELDGRQYVVLSRSLSRGTDVLAIYRVRADGVLKGLRRWPDIGGLKA